MADNVQANPGTGGAVFASDEVGAVQWPYAKLAWGPRDVANEVEDATGKRVPVRLGSGVVPVNMALGVTSNTTLSPVTVPPGVKTFWGELIGSGSFTQTFEIYGARTNAAANGVLLCTLTLSNVTPIDVGAGAIADYPFYYVKSLATTGTPTGRVDAFVGVFV